MSIKEKYKLYKLDDLCKFLMEEINELSQEENKLKVAYVLMHIIEESQKALGEINTKDFVTVLKEKIENVCKESEKQKDALDTWFKQNKQVREVIDGTNDGLKVLEEEIAKRLNLYDSSLKSLKEQREKKGIHEIAENNNDN